MNIWNWINCNDAVIIAISTVVYVIATIAICFANFMSADRAKKQLAEMINQQKQNVGITLYERRKNLIEDLRGTSGLQLAIIDSLEIEFLFNAEIYDSFNKILNEVDRLKKKKKTQKSMRYFFAKKMKNSILNFVN